MTPIVFIGPMAAGKSTLATALSRRLGRRQVPMDAMRFASYVRQGMDWAEMMTHYHDFEALMAFWKPYELPAVASVLSEFPDAVIDLGAGHAHYIDPVRRASFRQLMRPLPHVFLVLPHLDVEEATRISIERDRERLGSSWDPVRGRCARAFVESESMREVATSVLVTEGRSVDVVIDEVVGHLGTSAIPTHGGNGMSSTEQMP